jgi:flagellar motor switch protein FliN
MTDDVEQALEAAAHAVLVQTQKLAELSAKPAPGEPLGLGNLLDVTVEVAVEVGRTRLSLAELVKLGPGSLVVLDRDAHAPADILASGKVVARGEVVTIDGVYGVRVTSIVQGG